MTIQAQDIINKINELGKGGSNITRVAASLGKDRSHIHKLINKWPTVRNAIDQKKQEYLDELTESVQERAMTDNTMAIFYLKTQGGWRETSHIEHGGEVSIKIEREDY